MIIKKPHMIARKLADKFRLDLSQTHPEFLRYPLNYLQLKVAITEHLDILIEEIDDLQIKKIKYFLTKLNLPFPNEPYDDFLEVAGFMYAYDGGAVVFIEGMDNEERKKFSLLHELSHYLNEYYRIMLRTKDHGTLPLFTESNNPVSMIAARCTKNDIFMQIYGREEKESQNVKNKQLVDQLLAKKQERQNQLREKVCDWFSAEMLMPIDILKDLERQWILKKLSFAEMVDQIQSEFGVSRLAAKVRAQEVQLGKVIQLDLL
jgi:Zn-dependent peptidase ImmA (M78 family)